MECSSPTNKNGTLIGFKYKVGAVANFRCYDEALLIGSPRRQCLPDGLWSAFKAECFTRNLIISIITHINIYLLMKKGNIWMAKCFSKKYGNNVELSSTYMLKI